MQLPAFYRYCSESNRNSVISPITSSQSQNTGADPICNARRSLRRGADKTVLDHPRLRSVSLSAFCSPVADDTDDVVYAIDERSCRLIGHVGPRQKSICSGLSSVETALLDRLAH